MEQGNDIIKFTNKLILVSEEPPFFIHSVALSSRSFALHLISPPSSWQNNFLTLLSIFPLSNFPSNSNSTFQTSWTYLAFIIWSAKWGLHIIGTPSHMLSNVEFQPLWVQKPPTAWCRRTSCCGAQFTTIPLPRVVSLKPLGRPTFPKPWTEPGLIIQRQTWWK